MQGALFLNDSYLKEFDACIIDIIDHNKIVLDQTAFYPQGGGQASDDGVLVCNGHVLHVESVSKDDDRILHHLANPHCAIGDHVHGTINWEKRYALMRMHTASHVLAAVMHDQYECKITGNQLSTDKMRVDFSLEHFDREIVDSAIKKANELIALNLPVSISYLPREEAQKDPSLVKLAGALPPAVKVLRIVTIGNDIIVADRQADGGTHVKNTSEVGCIVLLKADNRGKSNRRVYAALK